MKPTELLDRAGLYFGVPPELLKSSSRRARTVDKRRFVAAYLKKHHIPLKSTAELLGRSDHTTTINWLRKHDGYMEHDANYQQAYKMFEETMDNYFNTAN